MHLGVNEIRSSVCILSDMRKSKEKKIDERRSKVKTNVYLSFLPSFHPTLSD